MLNHLTIIIVPEATSSEITIEYHLQDDSHLYSPENHLLASVGHTLYHENVSKPISCTLSCLCSSPPLFYNQDSFMIYDGMDGTTTHYSIVYEDSNSIVCDMVTIPASSCANGTCRHTLNLTQSPCSQSDVITTYSYATNLLGNSVNSDPLMIRMFT